MVLKRSFQPSHFSYSYSFLQQFTHTLVIVLRQKFICFIGESFIDMGSSSVLRSVNPRSGCVFPYSVCLYCVCWGGLLNMRPRKLCSSSAFRPVNPQSDCVCPHSVCVNVLFVKTPDKHGAQKVVFKQCFEIS